MTICAIRHLALTVSDVLVFLIQCIRGITHYDILTYLFTYLLTVYTAAVVVVRVIPVSEWMSIGAARMRDNDTMTHAVSHLAMINHVTHQSLDICQSSHSSHTSSQLHLTLYTHKHTHWMSDRARHNQYHTVLIKLNHIR